MPDFFKGEPLPLSLYPPDTDEKKKTAMEFMAGPANVPKNVDKLVEAVKEAKGKYGTVESWGTYGLCWGGKLCEPCMTLKAKDGTQRQEFMAESTSTGLDPSVWTRHRLQGRRDSTSRVCILYEDGTRSG